MTRSDSARKMLICKYIPNSLYGFALDSTGQQVFFHLGTFNPNGVTETPATCKACHKIGCTWGTNSPPPVLGESVWVELEETQQTTAGQAPRAKSITRIEPPVVVEGIVDVFDANRGFGFVKGRDGKVYHLHRSEMVDGRLPQPGQKVVFYAGIRQGKPRACHAKVCP